MNHVLAVFLILAMAFGAEGLRIHKKVSAKRLGKFLKGWKKIFQGKNSFKSYQVRHPVVLPMLRHQKSFAEGKCAVLIQKNNT